MSSVTSSVIKRLLEVRGLLDHLTKCYVFRFFLCFAGIFLNSKVLWKMSVTVAYTYIQYIRDEANPIRSSN